MKVTLALLDTIAGRTVDRPNANSLIMALDQHDAGIGEPQRLAHFLAQVTHECADFRYDREIWGPTTAQAKYDTRADLGNTPAVDGDGYANRGMGPIQLTGGHNRRAFRSWLIGEGFGNVPDFVGNENLLTDPWEGLSAVWYWDAGNPTGVSLNAYADVNNAEMITRRINGGLNGYEDRLARYTKAALAILGYPVGEGGIRQFQSDSGLKVDGLAGPATRGALHEALLAVRDEEAAGGSGRDEIRAELAAIRARIDEIERGLG